MVSINTNLSSLIAQRNMTMSTNKLNQAIERMSTGYKINHAGDNAANYSISQNMNVQLSACDIAADNIAMGMDLLTVAQDTIAGMQDRGSRIHALITQARNGTYGADSLNAMTQEANALVSEINRLYVNTEYNGIKLFDGIQLPEWAQEVKATAGTINGMSLEDCARANNGFIAEVVCDTPEVTITNPLELEDAINDNTIIGIGNAETLAELAELVNSGTTCEGKTIILTENIDLSAYQEGEGWTPIGNSTNKFQGTFNGNGHKVRGLYINRQDENSQGFFGSAGGTLKNVGIENINVTGNVAGGLIGSGEASIKNCYTTGKVNSSNCSGGLAAQSGTISDSYSTCTVSGGVSARTGGLVGFCPYAVTNCFATGDVNGGTTVGGLIGTSYMNTTNCYAKGNVTGDSGDGYNTGVGGLIGNKEALNVIDCYATGDVRNSGHNTGGLLGSGNYRNITGCYTTGDVYSEGDYAGGIAGGAQNITNCFTTGKVICDKEHVNDISPYGTITNCEAFKASSASAIVLQAGIHSDAYSQISVDTNLSFSLSISDLTSDSAYNSITSFLNQLSQKSTEIGAAQNRLESALESNMVQMDNLTSSLSTIRDADISKVSSEFIRQQTLQQAAATLMSTANQSPAIALQLL